MRAPTVTGKFSLEDTEFGKMGVVLSGHHLAWGWKHGWFRWLPLSWRGALIAGWNLIACRVLGHDTFAGVCTACCMEIDSGYD